MVAASVASPRTSVASKNRTELRPPGTVAESNTVTAAKSSGTRRAKKNAASDSEDEYVQEFKIPKHPIAVVWIILRNVPLLLISTFFQLSFHFHSAVCNQCIWESIVKHPVFDNIR
jgi:hypothetical protein